MQVPVCWPNFLLWVCLCMLARQRETLKNWNLVAPPQPRPTGHASVCVCGNAWVYSPLKPKLTRSWVAAAERVSTDKRIWVSTILLFDSDIMMSFSEPRQQGDVGGGIRGNWENKTGVVDCQSGARGRWRLITEKRLEQQPKKCKVTLQMVKKTVDKRAHSSWRLLLSLNPSFSLCWRLIFSSPGRTAGWSASHS